MIIDRYPVCKCGHSKFIHRERFIKQFNETRKCGDPNYNQGICFCAEYMFDHFKYYLDAYATSSAVGIIGKIVGIILFILLSLISITTLLWISGMLIVAIPVIISSLINKH